MNKEIEGDALVWKWLLNHFHEISFWMGVCMLEAHLKKLLGSTQRALSFFLFSWAESICSDMAHWLDTKSNNIPGILSHFSHSHLLERWVNKPVSALVQSHPGHATHLQWTGGCVGEGLWFLMYYICLLVNVHCVFNNATVDALSHLQVDRCQDLALEANRNLNRWCQPSGILACWIN